MEHLDNLKNHPRILKHMICHFCSTDKVNFCSTQKCVNHDKTNITSKLTTKQILLQNSQQNKYYFKTLQCNFIIWCKIAPQTTPAGSATSMPRIISGPAYDILLQRGQRLLSYRQRQWQRHNIFQEWFVNVYRHNYPITSYRLKCPMAHKTQWSSICKLRHVATGALYIVTLGKCSKTIVTEKN